MGFGNYVKKCNDVFISRDICQLNQFLPYHDKRSSNNHGDYRQNEPTNSKSDILSYHNMA